MVKLNEGYEYGVIYAIDFSDIPDSCLAKEAKGIYSTCAIPKENIVGKIICKSNLATYSGDGANPRADKFWEEKLNI